MIDEILKSMRIGIENADPTVVFFVMVRDVRAMVEAFQASGTMHCTSFRPDAMRDALNAIPPEVITEDGTELVSMDSVTPVIERFECYKLTGHCNTWTDWMAEYLFDRRVALLKEREVAPQHLHLEDQWPG